MSRAMKTAIGATVTALVLAIALIVGAFWSNKGGLGPVVENERTEVEVETGSITVTPTPKAKATETPVPTPTQAQASNDGKEIVNMDPSETDDGWEYFTEDDKPVVEEVKSPAVQDVMSTKSYKKVAKAFTVNLEALEIQEYLSKLGYKPEADGYWITWRNWSQPTRAEERVALVAEAMKEKGYGDGFNDPVETPFKSAWDEPKKLHKELKKAILANPTLGLMAAEGLYQLNLGEAEKTVGELNPWILEMIKKADWSFAQPSGSNPRGIEVFLEKRDTADGYSICVSDEYIRYATGICLVLDQCTYAVAAPQSVHNYRLPVTTDILLVRAVLAEYQEDLPSLVYYYKTKDGSQWVSFGFNLFDKRFELFDYKEEVVPINPDPKPTPQPQPNPNPGPNPGPDPQPTPTPTPKPKPQKQPEKDPVKQGNANQGGGGNSVTDGAGDFEPEPLVPETKPEPTKAPEPAPQKQKQDKQPAQPTQAPKEEPKVDAYFNTDPPPTNELQIEFTNDNVGEEAPSFAEPD